MSNGHVAFLQGVYQSIFKDLLDRHPHNRKDLERDFSRLLSNVERRGIHHLMIDMVDFGKHFDKCLSEGRLTRSNIPCFGVRSSERPIPCFLKGMILRVFDVSGVLRQDCDVAAIRTIRQVLYLAKKFKIEATAERKYNVLKQFFTVEQELPSCPEWDDWGLGWPDGGIYDRYHRDSHQVALPGLQSLEEESSLADKYWMPLCQEVFDLLSSTIGSFDPMDWQAKHGPGAVSDMQVGRSKYDFPTWPDKLSSVFPIDSFGFANMNLWATFAQDPDESRFSRNEAPSKLIMVPKTLKAPRLIASEPVSHQWCQQLIRSFLEHRVKQTALGRFIHFGDQSFNQTAALQGSASGKLATVDLSDASDRLSCMLVGCAFRKNKSLLDALRSVRTRWCVNTIDSRLPRYHYLRKFACMGSACTFPIQSIVFLGLALTAVLFVRKHRAAYGSLDELFGSVHVFGDDIVVPTDSVGVLKVILERVGLKVNEAKTFGTGRFRESCGVDAFAGVNVTPTYVLKQPSVSRPESVISSVATANNLYNAGYFACARKIKSTVLQLYSNIAEVAADSGCFGFASYGPLKNRHLKVRFSKDLHRREYFCLQPRGRETRSPNRGDDAIFQYFTERPSPMTDWSSGFATRRTRTFLRPCWVNV